MPLVPLKLSKRGADLIKEFESLELESYPDPASPLGRACTAKRLKLRDYRQIANWKDLPGDPWTIGWGHTGADVRQGMVISIDQAEELFRRDVEPVEKAVNSLVTRQPLQHEFDALCSFAFNVGTDIDADTIAEGLGDSTLLKKFNAGDYVGCANEFGKWVKAQGQVLPGLVARREKERRMFWGQPI